MACTPGCDECERLRSVALELVGEFGLRGVTIDALADRSGLPCQEVPGHYDTPSECVYATYDELSARIALDMADAFSQASSWEAGFALARERLLRRMAEHPAEARLCFVEVLRGDDRLRMRRVETRRWIVEFLASQQREREPSEPLSEVQVEMMVGAGFQAISAAVSAAKDTAELEQRLTELADALALLGGKRPG